MSQGCEVIMTEVTIFQTSMITLVDRIQRNCVFLQEVSFRSFDDQYNPVFHAFNFLRAKHCSIKVIGRSVYIKNHPSVVHEDNEMEYQWAFSLKR